MIRVSEDADHYIAECTDPSRPTSTQLSEITYYNSTIDYFFNSGLYQYQAEFSIKILP